MLNTVDGCFHHETAQAFVLSQPSISYSTLCNLGSTSGTTFRGLALTVVYLDDIKIRQGEVREFAP